MTTRSKLFRNIFLAAWLLTGLFWANAAYATVLTVQQHNQEQDQWCWDATSQAILEYYGVVLTQTQIAAYGTPGSPDTWNYLYGVETDPTQPTRNGVDLILQHFAGLSSTPYENALSEADLTSQINLLRPIAIRWAWDTGGGHILTVRGITGNTVYLMDPWPGDLEISTYSWVVRSASDGHTWTHSLTVDDNPPDNVASIDTPVCTSITTTGATLGATIESDGAAVVTASGVVYSTNPNHGHTGISVKTVPTATSGPFTVRVARLALNTVYYFCGYATNAAGTVYTNDSTFTTVAGAPRATAATNIKASGFTANWKTPSGTAPISGYLLYVATDSGFNNLILNGVSVSNTSYFVHVPGPGQYYYKVSAVNGGGTSACSGTIKVTIH